MAQRSLGLQDLGEHLLNPVISGVSIVTADGVRLLRAYGLSDHPNILGGCLAFGMLILFSAYMNGSKPTIVLAAFLPGVPALLVTFSRSAWLAFLGGTGFIIGSIIIQASMAPFETTTLAVFDEHNSAPSIFACLCQILRRTP